MGTMGQINGRVEVLKRILCKRVRASVKLSNEFNIVHLFVIALKLLHIIEQFQVYVRIVLWRNT